MNTILLLTSDALSDTWSAHGHLSIFTLVSCVAGGHCPRRPDGPQIGAGVDRARGVAGIAPPAYLTVSRLKTHASARGSAATWLGETIGNYHDHMTVKAATAALPAAASILTSLVGLLDDDRPESERVARELRKRLGRARHLAEKLEEDTGKAVYARRRAELSKGKERKKWTRRANLAEARAAGHREGLNVMYEEMAMSIGQPLVIPQE